MSKYPSRQDRYAEREEKARGHSEEAVRLLELARMLRVAATAALPLDSNLAYLLRSKAESLNVRRRKVMRGEPRSMMEVKLDRANHN